MARRSTGPTSRGCASTGSELSPPTRRALLLAGSAAAAGLLAGCGSEQRRTPIAPAPGASERIRYGSDPSQYVVLRRPRKTPLGTVVLLHGGYWLAGYGADLMDPLAERLTSLGYATWNVEYRRISQGGGYPTTLEDAASAVDRLSRHSDLAGRVVLLGHSAGGHLAGWLASRRDTTPGGASQVRLRGAISLSGVLDLTLAASAPGSSGPVLELMGGTPQQRSAQYALADPSLLVPAACPVWAMHADRDTVVPRVQATSYVEKAVAAHGRAEVVDVPGDHFTLIDPADVAFERIQALITLALKDAG